ncbi:MAG: class I SAM-dependent methyltransferase [Rhodospirillales bacterium]|nr:class I SAM-dependent methyltransferase [Rhodospirillales bacterium]
MMKRLLKHMIRDGALEIEDAAGKVMTVGDASIPACRIKLHKKTLEWSLLLNPPVKLAEAYMDGSLTVEKGDIGDLTEIMAKNYSRLENHWLAKPVFHLNRQSRWIKQYNPIGKAQRNVAHHYDLSGRLYDLFLDRDRQYSCAYFEEEHGDLERAQLDKKRHIAAKLLLNEAGLRLLDIGSGWGGMGLYLASLASARVVGVTLSEEQHRLSRERAEQAGLADRVDFRLQDYRTLAERFERIVSVGMFEHVGKKNYREFFGKLRGLLTENGVCLLHTIARFNEPGPINPFIRKYIFPGADLPTLSELLPAIEDNGLFVTDIEILRLHYAETLKLWRQRFNENHRAVEDLYDARFYRMWELYLAGCEMGFRHQGLMVVQVQMTRRQETLPLTRDYMFDWERAQAVRDARGRPQATK